MKITKNTTSPYIKISRSGIHGRGVFARRDIPKGAKIIEYVGEKIAHKESDRRADIFLGRNAKDRTYGAVYIFELNKRQDIDGNVPYNTARYINHSCTPNAESEIERGRIWIMALREIKKGEEIFYNYGYDFENFQEHPCFCKTERCVGYIMDEKHWPRLKRHMEKKSAGPANVLPVLMAALILLSGSMVSAADGSVQVTVLKERGGRVDVSPDGSLIAFDAQGKDGYTDIFTMDADGNNEHCLTCDEASIPSLHNGNPVWHPSGKYIAFQSQDPRYPGLPLLGGLYTSPGSGVNNDVAVINTDGTGYRRLTALGKGGAVLHPQFSHDGKTMIWAQRQASKSPGLGQWAIKMADFVIGDDAPQLSNIRELRPGGFQMYETHGFSLDDRQILFTACPDSDFFHSEIYLYEIGTKALTRLTDNKDNWDEHAHFLPGGEFIVWMSSADIKQKKLTVAPRTDYWIMRHDGTQKERLTYFNADADNKFYKTTAADFSPDPNGGRLIAYLINANAKEYRKKGPGPLVVIELK